MTRVRRREPGGDGAGVGGQRVAVAATTRARQTGG